MSQSQRKAIYLAGGMKSDWQDRVIMFAPAHVYLDPRKHGLSEEKAYTEWDLRAIRDSYLVLAYMDSANPSGFGLSLEVGYAKAFGREIWYVNEDSPERQKRFGMVRACATRYFTSLTDAIKALNE